jgi:hypothetical protein
MKNKQVNYRRITTKQSLLGGSASGAGIVFIAKTCITSVDFKTTIIYFSAAISSFFTYYIAPYILRETVIFSQRLKISKLKKEKQKLTTENAIKDCDEAIETNESWLIRIISEEQNIN